VKKVDVKRLQEHIFLLTKLHVDDTQCNIINKNERCSHDFRWNYLL